MLSNYRIAEEFGLVPEGYEQATIHGQPQEYAWHKTDTKAPYWVPPKFDESIDAILSLVPELDSLHVWKTKEGWKAEIGLHNRRRFFLSSYEPTKYEALLSAVVLAVKGE